MNLERVAEFIKMATKRVFGFYVKRPIQRFNVEKRAERVLEKIEKDYKPLPAPRHAGTQDKYEEILREHPEIMEEINSRPQELLERLKSVKVTSEDSNPSVMNQDENVRVEDDAHVKDKFPKERFWQGLPSQGFIEPHKATKGRVTLTDSIDFIVDHTKDPVTHSSQAIATKFDLNLKDTENILKYFKPFRIYSNKESKYNTSYGLLDMQRINDVMVPKYLSEQEKQEEQLFRRNDSGKHVKNVPYPHLQLKIDSDKTHDEKSHDREEKNSKESKNSQDAKHK